MIPRFSTLLVFALSALLAASPTWSADRVQLRLDAGDSFVWSGLYLTNIGRETVTVDRARYNSRGDCEVYPFSATAFEKHLPQLSSSMSSARLMLVQMAASSFGGVLLERPNEVSTDPVELRVGDRIAVSMARNCPNAVRLEVFTAHGAVEIEFNEPYSDGLGFLDALAPASDSEASEPAAISPDGRMSEADEARLAEQVSRCLETQSQPSAGTFKIWITETGSLERDPAVISGDPTAATKATLRCAPYNLSEPPSGGFALLDFFGAQGVVPSRR